MTAPVFGSRPRRPTIGLVATDPPSGKGRTTVWLTPRPLVEALGPFDLDPCAAPEPRPWPTAKKHITLPEDGLNATWTGDVWLNPPYSRSIAEWTDRLIDHGFGMALVFARCDTHWWQRAADAADAIFLPLGRVKFLTASGRKHDGPGGSAATASCILAFGDASVSRLRTAHSRAAVRGILLEHKDRR